MTQDAKPLTERLHPGTGLHYVNVINGESLAFHDYYLAYNILSDKIPWMSVVTPTELPNSEYIMNEKCLLIFWHREQDLPHKRARTAARYTEGIGRNLLSGHQEGLNRFIDRIKTYDFVLAHTPQAVGFLKQFSSNVFLAPVGYCHEIFGEPEFNMTKKYDVIFYGGIVGKRNLLKQLSEATEHDIYMIPGTYGEGRHKLLQQSRAVLHIPQIDDCVFPTMRIWQSIASSAMMLLEPVDAYPAIPGAHYIEIPRLAEDTIDEVAKAIDMILYRSDLHEIARKAYADLSEMTVQKCFEEYVIPASALCHM